MPLQLRRGTTAERLSIVPLPGEPILDTDLNTIFIGNGITAGGISALTGITSEDAMDIVGQMFLNGQHEGLTFLYGPTQDGANRIDAKLDFSSYDGEFVASAFRGSLFANDSTLLVNADTGQINPLAISGTFGGPIASSQIETAILLADNMFGALTGDVKGSIFSDSSTLLINAVDSSINLDGTIKGDVIPAGNELYDLGSSSNRFKDLYLSGTSIFLGDATITATGTTVNLPAGSTVGGTPIGSGTAVGDGVVPGSNYNINIVADDSSILVNSSTGKITGIVENSSVTTQFIQTSDSSELIINSPARFRTTIFTDDEFVGDLLSSRIETRNINNIGISSIDISSTENINITAKTISMRSSDGQINIGSASESIDGNLYIVRNSYESTLLRGFTFAQHHETADSVKFNFFRSRGTSSSPTVVQNDDDIIDINFVGIGTAFSLPTGSTIAARISVKVDGIPDSRVPGKIQFLTNNGTGLGVRAELSKDGIWRVNRLTAWDSGIISIETMPKLPEYADETAAGSGRGVPPENGMMYYDSGSSQVKVYANGAWHAITP